MIIVSQDKELILNFENIEAIGIGNPLEDNDEMFKVLASTTSDNEYTLGRYSTEERAKEVLQEIMKEYYEYDKRMQNKPDWHTTKYYEAKALEKLLEE